MPSRDLNDLRLDVREMCQVHLRIAVEKGISLVVYQTRRTMEEQALYYAQGRLLDSLPSIVVELIEPTIHKWRSQGYTRGPGEKITYALPSIDAPHIKGIAYDCAPKRFDRLVWSDFDLPAGLKGQTNWKLLWDTIGELGESCGLEWGGRWKKPDCPHFQAREEYR